MCILTDKDIRKLLGKEIVIEPFLEDGLTPIGYDFHVGNFVYSLEQGLLEPSGEYYELPPESTVLILTKESLWVSKKIGGHFHSKVSLVSKGLSHISTTLDPDWYGPLLIALRNNNKDAFQLKKDAAFVTLILSRVITPTATPHGKLPFRRDILRWVGEREIQKELDDKTQKYVQRVMEMLDNQAMRKFENEVKKANDSMISKIASSIKSTWRRKLLNILKYIAFCVLEVLILALGFYWENIKHLVGGIPYDSTIFSMQIMAALTVLSIFVAWIGRRST